MFVGKSRLVGCIPINSPMKSPKIPDFAQFSPFNPHLPVFFINFPWIWQSFYIFQAVSTPIPWVSPGHTSRTLDLAQKGPKVKHKRPSNSTAPLTSDGAWFSHHFYCEKCEITHIPRTDSAQKLSTSKRKVLPLEGSIWIFKSWLL
jgi:hypothetical protein